MATVAEFSRQIGQILGSFPYTLQERDMILKEMGYADSIDEMSLVIQALLARAVGSTPSTVDRANPNHDPHSGKFAHGGGSGGSVPAHSIKAGGLTAEQHDAITPRPGNTKKAALKSLNSTREGEVLVATTNEWQNDMSAVTRLQTNFMKRSQGKKLTKKEDEKATALMNGIRNSAVSPPLYRGVRLPVGSDPEAMHKVGSSFILPPSSFTSSSRMGRGFANAKTGRPAVPVVYRVNKGGRALPIEVYGNSAYKNEKEHISAGQFRVTGVTKGRDGVYTVDVDHDAMFEW